MTHTTFYGAPISERKHTFSKLVNGLVCENCNSGWMSQLEADCKNHITNLMNMRNLENELEYLTENYETVAKWAFKNAIMLNSATNFRRLVPDEHYKQLFLGKIPNGIFIDFAFCKNDPKIDWQQTENILILKSIDIPFNKNSIKYRIPFQIKNLAFKIAYYESLNNTFYEDKGANRIFPGIGLCGKLKDFKNISDFDAHGFFTNIMI